MKDNKKHIVLLLVSGSALWIAGGCSNDMPPTGNLTVSKQDFKNSQIARAKLILDSIEKVPPENRQAISSMPRNAEALSAAMAIDPSTKVRAFALGIHLGPIKQN